MYDDNKLAREILVINALTQKPPLNVQRGWRSKIWSEYLSTSILCVCEQRRICQDCAFAKAVQNLNCFTMSLSSLCIYAGYLRAPWLYNEISIKISYAGLKIDDSAEL